MKKSSSVICGELGNTLLFQRLPKHLLGKHLKNHEQEVQSAEVNWITVSVIGKLRSLFSFRIMCIMAYISWFCKQSRYSVTGLTKNQGPIILYSTILVNKITFWVFSLCASVIMRIPLTPISAVAIHTSL